MLVFARHSWFISLQIILLLFSYIWIPRIYQPNFKVWISPKDIKKLALSSKDHKCHQWYLWHIQNCSHLECIEMCPKLPEWNVGRREKQLAVIRYYFTTIFSKFVSFELAVRIQWFSDIIGGGRGYWFRPWHAS